MSSQTPYPLDDHILQAAEALLQEVGDGFTMDQLVSRAGVPRATIYRRVGSKEALLQRLAEQGVTVSTLPDVRQRILNGARQAFGQYGLLNTTLEQVAAEAEVGVATIYRHFGDKDGLVRAFLEERSPQTKLQSLALHPSDDIAADLTTFIQTILPFVHSNRDLLALGLQANPKEQAYLRQMRLGSTRLLDRVVAYFQAQLDAGRLPAEHTPHELALALVGLIFGFGLVGPIYYGVPMGEPEHITRLIVTLFLQGLKP